MIPLVSTVNEFNHQKALIQKIATAEENLKVLEEFGDAV